MAKPLPITPARVCVCACAVVVDKVSNPMLSYPGVRRSITSTPIYSNAHKSDKHLMSHSSGFAREKPFSSGSRSSTHTNTHSSKSVKSYKKNI